MKKILCIDIGGTRIKSAVLPERPTFDDLQSAPSMVIRTLGWLNHSLPKLLDPEHWSSLAAYYQKQGITYDAVALSVPGPVDSAGRFRRLDLVNGKAKVPENLLEALKSSAGCPVSVIKDADAWMMGFQAYAEASGIHVDYPAVIMALGTGFGISVASSASSVASITASRMQASLWKKLREASALSIKEGWHVHSVIGVDFFRYAQKLHPEWDHLGIRNEYTKRVKAAFKDIRPWIEQSLENSLKTVILTGGNAEYVSVRSFEETGLKVFSLTEHLCTLSPDLITVLGVEASARRPSPDNL